MKATILVRSSMASLVAAGLLLAVPALAAPSASGASSTPDALCGGNKDKKGAKGDEDERPKDPAALCDCGGKKKKGAKDEEKPADPAALCGGDKKKKGAKDDDDERPSNPATLCGGDKKKKGAKDDDDDRPSNPA